MVAIQSDSRSLLELSEIADLTVKRTTANHFGCKQRIYLGEKNVTPCAYGSTPPRWQGMALLR